MRKLNLKEEPSAGEYNCFAQEFFKFLINFARFSWTSCFAVFSSWLVDDLVMALNDCNFEYIFIFHFSQVSPTLFVQNSFLFFFWGVEGNASLWKKKKCLQNSTPLFWTYMYFCNVLKNQYKKANTSINVAIALWLNLLFNQIISFFCSSTGK